MKILRDTNKTAHRFIRSKFKSGKNHASKLVGPKARRG